MSKIPAKTACDNCGRIQEASSGCWKELIWVEVPPNLSAHDLFFIQWANGLDVSTRKDLCSWKCLRDYGAKQHIKETA